VKSIPAILRALIDGGVQFVLVGGFAVQLHGFVRTTLDLDLVLSMDDVNLSKFVQVAKRFELAPVAPVPIESLENASLLERWHHEKGMLAFALRESRVTGSVIDVLIKSEVPFAKLKSDAVIARLFDRDIAIASIDDLITMKLVANRPKDRLDIEALERLKIWLSNPLLAHQAGRRVEELISTLSEVQRRRAQDLR
jgi:hypothetical protein